MFLEQDLKLLGEVFSLARVHTVNSQPTNRQALENLMNFEAIFKNKCVAANEALGVTKETVEETPVDTAEIEAEITNQIGE